MIAFFRRWFEQHPVLLLTALSAFSFGLSLASIVLTDWLSLHPCHLCIFQRTLFFVIGLFLLFAIISLLPCRRCKNVRYFGALWLLIAFLLALTGAGTAAFQSVQQWFPEATGSCLGAEPSLIEQVVEWLGERAPDLFMATGFCDSKELTIFWLSLANWAFLAFVGIATKIALLFWWLFFGSVKNTHE